VLRGGLRDREEETVETALAHARIVGVIPPGPRAALAADRRLVPLEEVSRLLGQRRQAAGEQRRGIREPAAGSRRPATREPRIVAQSARNRFAGVVTRIERDSIAAVVEVMAGPHRLVSLMTAEAVEEMGLRVGDQAICVVKATNVIVEIHG